MQAPSTDNVEVAQMTHKCDFGNFGGYRQILLQRSSAYNGYMKFIILKKILVSLSNTLYRVVICIELDRLTFLLAI